MTLDEMDYFDRRSYELYNPEYAKHTVEVRKYPGVCKYLAKLDDGRVILFNTGGDNRVRFMPEDPMRMTDEEIDTEFGIRLQEMMKWRGWMSQAELSERTGIPQSRISEYINGRRTPNFRNLDRIAKALDCSVDFFRYTGF